MSFLIYVGFLNVPKKSNRKINKTHNNGIDLYFSRVFPFIVQSHFFIVKNLFFENLKLPLIFVYFKKEKQNKK